jgi:hypothetical protein
LLRADDFCFEKIFFNYFCAQKGIFFEKHTTFNAKIERSL